MKHNALVLHELNSLLIKNSRNLCSTLAISSANFEFCPGIQDDVCHTNTVSTFVTNHTISSSSSENNSTNQTITTTMLKRHQASSSLATSYIENVKKCGIDDRRGSMSSYLIEEENSSTSQYNSSSSGLGLLKPCITSSTAFISTEVESLIEGEFLSSTKLSHRQSNRRPGPKFFHSTLRSYKNTEMPCNKKTTPSFGIFKSCSWKKSTCKKSKKKTITDKAYKFKLVQGKLSTAKQNRRHFPRTSSFNSNEDERDCDLNDFDLVEEELKIQSNHQCPTGPANDSFRVDQNGFTNIGDFFVWYV